MNLPIAPPPEAVKQPTLPKLRDVMGQGSSPARRTTIPAVSRPIPKPACSSLTAWDGLDAAVYVSTDVRDPADGLQPRTRLRGARFAAFGAKTFLSAICRIAVDRDSALSPA